MLLLHWNRGERTSPNAKSSASPRLRVKTFYPLEHANSFLKPLRETHCIPSGSPNKQGPGLPVDGTVMPLGALGAVSVAFSVNSVAEPCALSKSAQPSRATPKTNAPSNSDGALS